MKYQWADGFRQPKGITAEEVKAALDDLPEPNPELLLDATKSSAHVLHDEIWGEGDQVWANRARMDRCRRIIAAIHEVRVVGGKTITNRAIEVIRMGNDRRWATIEDISKSPDLALAYLSEVQKLQDQASAKLTRAIELLTEAGVLNKSSG